MFYKNLLIFGLIFITACGFTPMNHLSSDENITALTTQIALDSIPNKNGWLLKQQLQNKLNPEKKSVAAKYRLAVRLDAPQFNDQSIEGDAFASRETAVVGAFFELTDIQTNQVVLKETTTATGAYNVVKEPYATQMARNKLTENLIRIVAENITLRLTAYLKSIEDVRESQTISN